MPTILAIETSCDETAAAVIRDRTILSNIVSSQIPLHVAYGGVVPEVAARSHVETVNDAIALAYTESGVRWSGIDGIAVTVAPGLIGSLMVGVTAAKTLAILHQKPLIGIHHLEGHIFSAFLTVPNLTPPFLCLLVSGGHSSLIRVRDYGQYEVMGQTHDDAAGEAFDKVSRLLGLGYPGGPAIDRLSATGNPKAYRLPQGKIPNRPYDFSFSGLKTAVLRLVEKLTPQGDLPIADIAASFQETVASALVERAIACARHYNIGTIVAVGGVAANSALRSRLTESASTQNINVIFPTLKLCTDNAAMVGAAGAMHLDRGDISPLTIAARSRLGLIHTTTLYNHFDQPS